MPESFFGPEKRKETLAEINLRVVDPWGDKGFMIAFDGGTEEICRICNEAASRVLNESNLKIFHQVGISYKGDNEPGYHAWEIWGNIKKEELITVLEKIKQEMQSRFEKLE